MPSCALTGCRTWLEHVRKTRKVKTRQVKPVLDDDPNSVHVALQVCGLPRDGKGCV